MKKIISKLVLICSLISCAFAVEWGGLFSLKANPVINIDNPMTVDSISFQGIGDAYLWMNSALNKDKTLFFNSEIQYEASLFQQGEVTVGAQLIDIDLFKLSGTFEFENNSTFDFSFGRYQVMDSTGVVFSQESDGLFASYALPTVVISGYVGYTGLLNTLKVSMLDGTGTPESSDAIFYKLAHPYLPTNVTLEFPVLFGNQSLSLQANAFIDFKDSYNRYYANLVMTGPVTNTTYYKLSSSFGSANFDDLMNYTSFSLLMFPMSNISVTLGGEYASGDQLIFSPFRGFSSRVAYGSNTSPQTTAILIPNASFAWSMGSSIYTGLTGKFIMAGDAFEKTAAELATDLVYNLFSDLQLGLNIDWYVPFGISDENQKFSATLNVGVTF